MNATNKGKQSEMDRFENDDNAHVSHVPCFQSKYNIFTTKMPRYEFVHIGKLESIKVFIKNM